MDKAKLNRDESCEVNDFVPGRTGSQPGKPSLQVSQAAGHIEPSAILQKHAELSASQRLNFPNPA
jgi:hypothetical protein